MNSSQFESVIGTFRDACAVLVRAHSDYAILNVAILCELRALERWLTASQREVMLEEAGLLLARAGREFGDAKDSANHAAPSAADADPVIVVMSAPAEQSSAQSDDRGAQA